MKEWKYLALVLSLMCGFPAMGWATSPWGVVANLYSPKTGNPPVQHGGTLHTVDLGQTPPAVYGPFFKDQLVDPECPNPGNGVLDVTFIPNSTRALVSSFGDSMIYVVNLIDPTNPVLEHSIKLGILTDPGDPGVECDAVYDPVMFAEDIAVTPDGTLALVTDGGFASLVAFVDLTTYTLKGFVDLGDMDAQAVAIAPDNRTVLLADYFGGAAVAATLNASKDGFESLSSLTLCNAPLVDDDANPDTPPVCQDYHGWPINIAISPDGNTAIMAEALCGAVWMLRITGPGSIQAGTPFFLLGLPGGIVQDPVNAPYDCYELGPLGERIDGGQQGIAFSPDGQRAYVVGGREYDDGTDGAGLLPDRSPEPGIGPAYVNISPTMPGAHRLAPRAIVHLPDQLSWLQILGPGSASVGGAGVADLLTNGGGGAFFGVDVLAVSPTGTQALVGNKTSFSNDDGAVSLVDLSTFQVSAVSTEGELPTGIDIRWLALPGTTKVVVPVLGWAGLSLLALLLAGAAGFRLRRNGCG